MDRSSSITSNSSSKSGSSTGPFGLDRSNSISSNASMGSSGPFAYQTRLLERTSSRGGSGSSTSRTSSLTRTDSFSNSNLSPSGSGATPTRKWTATHRVANSLDTVRGKWEERVRVASTLENHVTPSPSRDMPPPPPPKSPVKYVSQSSDYLPYSSRSKDPEDIRQQPRAPPLTKRHTLPDHIMTSPLSPNNTGITVEGSDYHSSLFTTPTPQRIHLPTSTPSHSSSVKSLSEYGASASSDLPVPSRVRRTSTIDISTSNLSGSSKLSEASPISSNTSFHPSRTIYTPVSSTNAVRSTSNHSSQHSAPSSPEKHNRKISSASSTDHVPVLPSQPYTTPLSPSHVSSVMSPTPYRSSYMSNKNRRALAYGNELSVGSRLGRHLPRIASGDGDDTWVEERKEDMDRRRRRETRERERRARVSDANKLVSAPASVPISPRRQEIFVTVATDAGDVAGIPGRLRLSKDKTTPSAPASPLPSARLGRGLWADTQRQHLQAYEYLCHVGEAQQWIEGCLEEELGFGVVEMEEGLRNGVVLAKLVRVFQGERVVRRIYEVWQKHSSFLTC